MGPPGPDATFSSYLDQIVDSPETRSFGRRVAGWLQVAELRELLRWNLPTPSEWAALTEADVAPAVCESQWIADRFLLTYLGDWHTASLHEEFRWARGSKEAAVSSSNLALRAVPAERLNAEIAMRAVDGEGRDPRSLLSTGVELLQRGEHEQAVALFQGALMVSPSPWVRNCLAFCRVPSDPLAAAEILHKLLDDFDPALLHANLAATSRLRGDVPLAHWHARAGLDQLDESDGRSAHLWGFDGALLMLMTDVGLRDYLRFVLSWEWWAPQPWSGMSARACFR